MQYQNPKVFWCRYTICTESGVKDDDGKIRITIIKKRKDYRIGSYGEYTIEQARKRCKEIKGAGAEGKDLTKLEKLYKEQENRLKKSILVAFLDELYLPHMKGKKCGIKIYTELRSAFQCWHKKSLSEITSFLIRGWINQKNKEGAGPVGMNRKLGYLRTALSYAVSQNLIDENPFNYLVNDAGKPNWRRKEPNNNVVRRLSDDELQQLLNAMRVRDYKKRNSSEKVAPIRLPHWRETGFADHLEPMTLLALNCGLRRNEIFSLEWSDICLDTHIIEVKSHVAKNSKSRIVPMTSVIEEVLKIWKQQYPHHSSDEDLVFRSNKRRK